MFVSDGSPAKKQPGFGKIAVLSAACFLIITISFGVWKLTDMADDSKKEVLSIVKMYNVNIYGTQGEGYVDISVNAEYIERYEKDTGIMLNTDDIIVKVSKENNLSNDDRFTVSIENISELNKAGVFFEKSSVTYKVSGLKDGTDFDVFADLKLAIDDGDIVLDNSGCSNFVKDNVDFFIKDKKESYKEGDTVIIGAYVDMNAATDNGYNIKITEKEYILEQENNQ